MLGELTLIGVHLLSFHTEPGYKTITPGFYIKTNKNIVLGALENSQSRIGAYAGYDWEVFRNSQLSISVTGLGMVGYKRKLITGAAILSMKHSAAPIRLSVIPKPPKWLDNWDGTPPKPSAAFSISYEREFK